SATAPTAKPAAGVRRRRQSTRRAGSPLTVARSVVTARVSVLVIVAQRRFRQRHFAPDYLAVDGPPAAGTSGEEMSAVLERLASAQRAQVVALGIGAHPVRVHPRDLAQRPADRLADEEVPVTQVGLDQGAEQV